MLKNVVAVVPTLNEEEGIASVLSGLRREGVSDIVVVDGHSKDATLSIAKKFGAHIIMQEGKGKGAAFQTFLRKHSIRDDARYIMLDGDASYDPHDVSKMARALETAPAAAGNRSLLIHDVTSLTHAIGGTLISWMGSLLFLRWNPDICTGYWGFRGSALKKLRITANGFDLEANLFSEAAKKGIACANVPVGYAKRKGVAKLTFIDALGIVVRLVQDRFSP